MPKQTVLWGQPPPVTPSPAPPLDPDPSPSPGHGLGGLTEGTPCFRSEDGHSQRAPTQEVSLSSHKKKGGPSPSVVCLGGAEKQTPLKLVSCLQGPEPCFTTGTGETAPP